MKKFNNVDFVYSLAEVTRHYDRDVIERSLLKTLCDITQTDNKLAAEFRIYRVLEGSEKTALALMSYAKNSVIDTLDHEIKNSNLPEKIVDAINQAIETQVIQIVNRDEVSDKHHVIYPAINKSDEVFAILIHSCQSCDYESHPLIHGLLKVYGNYLELIDKAKRDKLTQLLNRETLYAEITRILIRNNTPHENILKFKTYPANDARKSNEYSSYWLGVIDIDFFKKINDSYGHLYGDEILILVARLIEKNIRANDFAFRYGGEEFVIVLLSNNFESAKAGFERIRIAINAHHYAHIQNLSVSIGFTQISKQDAPTEVIEQADKALYYAKENGRNQIQFYEELVQEQLITKPNIQIASADIEFF